MRRTHKGQPVKYLLLAGCWIGEEGCTRGEGKGGGIEVGVGGEKGGPRKWERSTEKMRNGQSRGHQKVEGKALGGNVLKRGNIRAKMKKRKKGRVQY